MERIGQWGQLQQLKLVLATHPCRGRGGSSESFGLKSFASSQVTGCIMGFGKQM